MKFKAIRHRVIVDIVEMDHEDRNHLKTLTPTVNMESRVDLLLVGTSKDTPAFAIKILEHPQAMSDVEKLLAPFKD